MFTPPIFRRRDNRQAGKARVDRHRRRPLVEELEAYMLLSTFTVTSNTDNGTGSVVGTLSWAIDRVDGDASDSKSSPDEISFSVGGGGAQTISPTAALPLITAPVIIDGETQSGYSTTTHIPLVRLDGSSAGSEANGLELSVGSSGSTIEGLDITDFGADDLNGYGSAIQIDAGSDRIIANDIGLTTAGIAAPNFTGVSIGGSGSTVGGTTAAERNVISGNLYGVAIEANFLFPTLPAPTDNVVEGNFIGTDLSGDAALANSYDGVYLSSSTANIVGGAAPGAGNVISGNGEDGIKFNGSTGNLVEGNDIGTDATGTRPVPNSLYGIGLFADDNTIGGTSAGARNVISGNDREGIFGYEATANLIEGNFIGTDATGTKPLGNGFVGVDLSGGSSDNTIGGTAAGAGNVIADNPGNASFPGEGVIIGDGSTDDSVGDAILGDLIYGNAGIAIDLGTDRVTPNDSKGHSGPNLFQDFPVITSAQRASNGDTVVVGTVEGPKSTTVTVSLYADPMADPSGHGQGQIYLGSVSVPIGPGGMGTINGFSTSVPLQTGEVITATTTDAAGNTSEFSQDMAIVPGPAIITPMVRMQASGFSVSRGTHQYTQTITITNTWGSAINGPVYLALEDLPSGVTLLTPSTPLPGDGSPAVEVSSGGLGVGQSITVTLVFSDPSNIVINYAPELLSNPFGKPKN